MTTTTADHLSRLADLRARTGMRVASELPPTSATPRPALAANVLAGPWDREPCEPMEPEPASTAWPSWLPQRSDTERKVLDLRLDRQADGCLAVVPVLRAASSSAGAGRRVARWDEAWDLRQLRELAPGGLDAATLQVVTLHDAAAIAWGMGDPTAAARFALAAVQAAIAHRSSICVGGEGPTPLPIRKGAAGVAVVAVDGGWALTLSDDGRELDPALVRGSGGAGIFDGVWLRAERGELVVLTVAPAIVEALARSPAGRDGTVPALDARALVAEVDRLRRVGIEPRIHPSLDIAAVASAGRVEMRLARIGGQLHASLRVALFGDAATWVPGAGEATALALRGGELVRCERDLDSELTHATAICAALGLPAVGASLFCWSFDQTDRALAFLSTLQAHSANLALRWDTAPMVIAQEPPDLTLRVPSRVDWLSGTVQIDGAQARLRTLLEAMRDGRRFVEVRGGVWLEIRARLRGQLQRVERHLATSAGEGDDPSAALARWNRARDLLRQGVHVEVGAEPVAAGVDQGAGAHDLAVERLERLHGQAMAMTVEVPGSLRAELRPYQRQGLEFLVRTAAWAPGALLADDMGLGKTVQALAFLLHRAARGAALVVAPASVLRVWQAEAAQFAPSLRVVVADGATLRVAAPPGAGTLLLCSWAALTRHVDTLAALDFATVVYDEAQMAKNPDTARANAARKVRAAFSLLLSGTPVENRALELWSLISIAVPGLLGDRRDFFEAVATPIEESSDATVARGLASLVAPFWLRRTKAQVADDLPARIEIDVPVLLGDAERRQYEIVRGAAVEAMRRREPEERALIFAAMTRLRQLACHPRLVDPTSTLRSAKLERALELLRELRDEGHRCLVFSQFTSHLDLVADAMAAEGFQILRLDGRCSARERQRSVERFQAGGADAMLISLGAGGTGLTLTAADSVLLLDPWWNPAAEAQAADRAHRIGQRRVVTIYRLLAVDTVETRVRELQIHKGRISDVILGELDGPSPARGPLDRATLHALLGDGDEAGQAPTGVALDLC